MNILRKVFGSKNDREIKRIRKTVDVMNGLEANYKDLSDEELQNQTVILREALQSGKTLDDILPEAFAVCREASIRVLGMRHFDVQFIGGIVLHEGRIAEMKTGEGKTLTATLAVYLNALAGKGVHVVTVNDYLAKRDSDWMGKLYRFLGLTTGCIVHGLSDSQRREAYHADVTYGTNNEFGFDYLRDNMKIDASRMVQRDPFFAIIDEVDSILIDEARTPLIISGPAETNIELYGEVNRAVPGLRKDSDYVIDEKANSVGLTEDGINKIERRLKVKNLYDPKNIHYLHHVEQALKAHFIFKKDVDYVVRDGQIYIVDEFTGRLMPGRRYSDGLHGALEAKEHVKVQNESQTLATVTYQNLFRMYEKLSGMTGTADTEAVEFEKIYKLNVVVIPTNKPLIRKDESDVIYRTAREKFNAIADEIAEAHKKKQPVLVGTVSVEKSELLAALLNKRGIPHEILNAKNHAREAEIVKTAGHLGRVTLSTNMAGRGTDIVLGEGVREVGGLFVLGTERHDSRRIDNQLRGRSGRQGDHGRTCFYLSLEDDLMRIFASDRLSGIMQKLGMKEGESIVSPMVTRAIEKAQRRVEEQNFSSRKNLLEYDDVMNQQRQVIYKRRNGILKQNKGVTFLEDGLADLVLDAVSKNSPETLNSDKWEFSKISEAIKLEFQSEVTITGLDEESVSPELISNGVVEQLMSAHKKKLHIYGSENVEQFSRQIYLQIIDDGWKDHLQSMDGLRDSVSLRGYGQRDPLQEYKKEGFRMFADLMNRIEMDAVYAVMRIPFPEGVDANQLDAPEHRDELESATMSQPDAAPVAGGAAADGDMVYTSNGQSSEAKPETFIREAPKVGRNDPCPCESGKKFKKCHGRPGAEPLASM